MKGIKIFFATLLSLIWLCVVGFVIAYLCREMSWALEFGQWCTNQWNTVFEAHKTVEGFYETLGRLLPCVIPILAIFTLLDVFLSTKLTKDEEDELEEELKADVKETVKETKKKVKKVAEKKAKKVKKKTEEVIETTDRKVEETTNAAIDNFLAGLRRK